MTGHKGCEIPAFLRQVQDERPSTAQDERAGITAPQLIKLNSYLDSARNDSSRERCAIAYSKLRHYGP